LQTGQRSAKVRRYFVTRSCPSQDTNVNRLSELDSRLKTRLLNRSSKGIESTAAGIALLNLARGVLYDGPVAKVER